MQITKHFTIDMVAKSLIETIYAVQGDSNTRLLSIKLLKDNVPWEIPSGVTAAVAFSKPDGTKGLYDHLPNGSSAITFSGSTVFAVLAPQVLTCAGEVNTAVVFHDANLNQLATFPFKITVDKNPAAGQEVSNDYYAYSTMEQVSQAVDAMLDSLVDTKAQLGQLVTQVNQAVDQVSQEAGPAIVCDASGELIVVSDASDRLLQGLSICGKTTQDGTPSPANPIPLVSAGDGGSIGVTVAGKNLLDMTQVQEGTATPGALQNAIITADCIDIVRKSSYDYASIPVFLVGGKTYTLWYQIEVYDRPSGATGNTSIQYGFSTSPQRLYATANGAHNQIVTITTSENIAARVQCYANYGSEVPAKVRFKIMLLEGQYTLETVPPFEPYKGNTLTAPTPNGLPGVPVTSVGNYTDASGQAWICDEIDLARGVYVQRVYKETVTACQSTASHTNGQQYAVCALKQTPISNAMFLCDRYMTAEWSAKNGYAYITTGSLVICDSRFTDQTTAASILSSEKPVVYYPLKTPIETALDADTLAAYAALHSNKPHTTVFNDAGAGQKLSYVADTKLYIDQKFTEVTNAIVAAIGTI